MKTQFLGPAVIVVNIPAVTVTFSPRRPNTALKTLAPEKELKITTRVDRGDLNIIVGGLAKVVSLDETKEGVIQAIDRVLFPDRNDTPDGEVGEAVLSSNPQFLTSVCKSVAGHVPMKRLVGFIF